MTKGQNENGKNGSGQNEKWSKCIMVKMNSGQNDRWSK